MEVWVHGERREGHPFEDVCSRCREVLSAERSRQRHAVEDCIEVLVERISVLAPPRAGKEDDRG